MRDCSAISRSFVVSFFTQRHPQTKTNITERNDGVIDGAKSKRRWDFGEFKDFISAASQSFPFTGIHLKTKDCGKVASRTWSFKIWLWKTWIFSYLQLTLKLSCWPLTHLHLTSSSYIWTSRTLSVNTAMVKDSSKWKTVSFQQIQNYATELTLFVGVALIWILRVLKALLRLSIRHVHFRGVEEGVGKREMKGKMSLP